MTIPPFKGMWLVVLFDLPVDTRSRRQQYATFRRALLKDGFIMLQYSVYARYCPSEEACQGHAKYVQQAVPPEGEVRLLRITDHQFGKMEVFCGTRRAPPERRPVQLELF